MDRVHIPFYVIPDPTSKGQLANLPTELILELAPFLQTADLCHYAAITSRNWQILRAKCHQEALRVALPTPEEYTKFLPNLATDEHVQWHQHSIQLVAEKIDISKRSRFVNAVTLGYIHAVRGFLNHGVNPNAYNIYGNRALVLAGHCPVPVAMSQVLLAYGADPNLTDPTQAQFTPLYSAAVDAQNGLARLLISHGADVNQEGVLQLLCQVCNRETVQNAIDRGANLHQRDRAGNTVVHSAAKNEDPDVLALLFNLGIVQTYLEDRNRAGKTPLMKAVRTQRLRNMALLLNQGADPNATYIDGTTALHIACRSEFIDGAFLLIEAGANVNAISGEGKAPLHYAAAIPSINLVRGLLQKKANVSVTDPEMDTPLHVACYHTQQRWLGHDELLELVKTLIYAGAPIMARSVGGQTPFSIARRNQDLELADLLITNNPKALDGESSSGREWSDYLRKHVYQSHAL